MMDTSFKYKCQFFIAKMALFICICLVPMRSSIGQEQAARVTKFEDDLVVSAEGTGASAKEALDNALIQSVQIAVGVLVVSERAVRDDSLSEKSITYSNAFVKTYQLIRNYIDTNSVFHAQIVASVSSRKILENIPKVGVSKSSVDSSDLYAQAYTHRLRLLEGDKLLNHVLSQYPNGAFFIHIDPVRLNETRRDGPALLQIPLTINLNKDFYSNLTTIGEITSSAHYPNLDGTSSNEGYIFFLKKPFNKILNQSPSFQGLRSSFQGYKYDENRYRLITNTFNKKIIAVLIFKNHTGRLISRACYDVSNAFIPFRLSLYVGDFWERINNYKRENNCIGEIPLRCSVLLNHQVASVEGLKDIAGVEATLSDSCK